MEELMKLLRAKNRFAEAMEEKLVSQLETGWEGWDDPANEEKIRLKLLEKSRQLAEGDITQAEDVANYAMFLWQFHQETVK